MRTRWMLAVVMLAATGCGADLGVDPAGTASNDDEARAAAWSTLAGSYTLNAGETGDFSAVVFERTAEHGGHHYFAESFASLIHCGVGTGCTTTHSRTEGWFTANASARTVTLHPASGAAIVLGYTHSGDSLVLTSGRHDAHYTAALSYCDVPADCDEEGLIHPLCAIRPGGGSQCSASHVCSYSCGGGGTVSDAGGACGGFVRVPAVCAAGLTCVASTVNPDLPGTCQQVSDVGGPCGGFIRNPPVCAAGLRCVYGGVPDLPGTCQR